MRLEIYRLPIKSNADYLMLSQHNRWKHGDVKQNYPLLTELGYQENKEEMGRLNNTKYLYFEFHKCDKESRLHVTAVE